MAFQPFGYRFEVISTMQPAELKAALRAGMKSWFDQNNGPRGWIVGPFMCLWRSAFDRHGPMLFGHISQDGFQTRLRGRAGSDLNGVLMFSLLLPLMVFLLYKMISEGPVLTAQILWFAGITIVNAVLIYSMAHKDRREAEPLVNFVRQSLSQQKPVRRRLAPTPGGPVLPVRLTVNGEAIPGSVTPESIQSAIDAMVHHNSGFVILARSEETYMQTADRGGGFVLEMREGSELSHFVGKRQAEGTSEFTAEEIEEALVAYLYGRTDSPFVRWERLF